MSEDEWTIDIKNVPHQVAEVLKLIAKGSECSMKEMKHKKYSEAGRILSEMISDNEPEPIQTLDDFDKTPKGGKSIVVSEELERKVEARKGRKKRKKNKGGTVVCGRCGRSGHNRKTCKYATHANGGYIKEEIPEDAHRK